MTDTRKQIRHLFGFARFLEELHVLWNFHGRGALHGRSMLFFLCPLLLLSVSGCENCGCEPPLGQPVYFEYRYMNWAWGTQDRGWLIDGEGNVRHFESPEGFRSADSTGLLTAADLEFNLAQTDSIITTISREELEEYIAYIPGAARGEIGEQRSIAADAGSSVLACYLYSEAEDAYKYVFLGMSGDWEQFNLSDQAGILVDWLREFGVFWISGD